MIIQIRSARVIIRPLANSVALPFFMAMPDTRVPKAFKIQKIGIDTIFIIIGPISGIAATRAPTPTNNSVKIPIIKAEKTMTFLSIP